MVTSSRSIVIGWEEWVALPDLGLPAIKAKIDTGARTSALHAYFVETFGPISAPMVRFGIHPIPGRSDIAVVCTAPVIDRREVTSSNGESELRYVIRTRVAMGGHEWPIEVTLANRESMSYRMLLGRQAIREDMFVDAASSFRQPRLSFKLYGAAASAHGAREPLTVAVLSRKLRSASNARIIAAAEAHGHRADILDPGGLTLQLGPHGAVLDRTGEPLGPFDVIVPRLAASAFAAAIVRQFELGGAHALNSADAMERLRSALAVHQILGADGIPMPSVRIDESAAKAGVKTAWKEGGDVSARTAVCVIGREAVAGFGLVGDAIEALDPGLAAIVFPLAARAAGLLGLGLARIDIADSSMGPAVVGVSPAPDIGTFEKTGGRPLAADIIAAATASVRKRA
jgi:ribosomal protein S6--L-glutamate ligase